MRKISSSGIITTVAGNGTGATNGDGGLATAASIGGCDAIAFDATGNFYISSNTSCSIRKVDIFGIISTVIGGDSCGFSGDGGPATTALIGLSAVCSATDGSGNLYFADSHNNRIRRITYDATSVNEVNIQQQT